MNFLTYLTKLLGFFLRFFFPEEQTKDPKISIIIPFSSSDPIRVANFKWLYKYWEKELPDSEIIIGTSSGEVFCKGEALNNAVRQSKGKVLVIMDADAYISGEVINYCADSILKFIDNKLWYVPYRSLYRLKREISWEIINSSPSTPIRISSPPPKEYVESSGDSTKYGHRYGAMCMIFPREAYDTLGCFDERFKGWGGEDVALLRAIDTLYGKHHTVKGDILHLWHPYIGTTYQTRKWEGQDKINVNGKLSMAYHMATRLPSKMRKLVDEGCQASLPLIKADLNLSDVDNTPPPNNHIPTTGIWRRLGNWTNGVVKYWKDKIK